jgi:hypothetical protein
MGDTADLKGGTADLKGGTHCQRRQPSPEGGGLAADLALHGWKGVCVILHRTKTRWTCGQLLLAAVVSAAVVSAAAVSAAAVSAAAVSAAAVSAAAVSAAVVSAAVVSAAEAVARCTRVRKMPLEGLSKGYACRSAAVAARQPTQMHAAPKIR